MVPLVILAGGRGTRLGALGQERPKFLMPISAARLFADVQLAWVSTQGFRDVVLCVGFQAAQIRAHVGDGARYGLRVRYAEDGEQPLGTGGALKQALPEPPPRAALLYGDTLLDIDCRDVLRAAEGTHALMTVIRCPPGEVANVDRADGAITYDKHGPRADWQFLDYGLSVLSDEFIRGLPERRPLDLADALTEAARAGRLRGYLALRPFYEINTPKALEALRRRLGEA